MKDRNAELKRLEKELLAEDETMDPDEVLTAEEILEEELAGESTEATPSVDDILEDEELNALLGEEPEPAFEDPDQTRPADGDVPYHNFANDYGKEEQDAAELKKHKNEKIAIGLMLAACVLCLGIIGILIYWLCVLP